MRDKYKILCICFAVCDLLLLCCISIFVSFPSESEPYCDISTMEVHTDMAGNEWISVNARLPEESGEYLVFTAGGVFMTLEYSSKHNAFNAYDKSGRESALSHQIKCSYWMPIPEPPMEVLANDR